MTTMTLAELIQAAEGRAADALAQGNATAHRIHMSKADWLRDLIGTDCDVPHNKCPCCKGWLHPEDFKPELFQDAHVAAVTAMYQGVCCTGCIDNHTTNDDGELVER